MNRTDVSRRQMLKGGAALGFAALFGLPTAAQEEGDNVQTMVNLAATAETLACIMYYTGLTAGLITFDTIDVVYIKAALDAELQHLEFLNANGGNTLSEEFYFPQNTFTDLATFVSVAEALETAFVGAYLAATRRAAEIGSSLLATTAAQIAAVEAQHLALIRLTGDLFPPNNISLGRTPFYNVSNAVPALRPFIEGGEGFLGPEYYLGAEAIRSLVGDGGVSPVPPATTPEAYQPSES